jgi:hypothetical protein
MPLTPLGTFAGTGETLRTWSPKAAALLMISTKGRQDPILNFSRKTFFATGFKATSPNGPIFEPNIICPASQQ